MCHAGSITRYSGVKLDDGNWRASAVSALLNAAELGHVWARAIVFRISAALGEPVLERCDVRSWLYDAASKGSLIALESLVEVNRHDAANALRSYRTAYCGNPSQLFRGVESRPGILDDPSIVVNERKDTVLHWVASAGDTSILQALPQSALSKALVNARNEQGDTPLLCATRAGHFEMLRSIIHLGADASIHNNLLENPLHFLTNMDEEDVPEAARLLFDAGADPDAEAAGYSGNTYLDPRARGRSCSRLRAIFANSCHTLSTLMELTSRSSFFSAPYDAIPLATQRTLLAWALRLHYPDMLAMLERYLRGGRLLNNLGQVRLWSNGQRYSLSELCILGCVSASPSFAWDMPEPVFQIITHGKDHARNLEASLGFLLRHEPTIFAQPCEKARNALFFAIKEGREGAVRFLALLRPWMEPGSLFNSPYNRWARCKEINGLLYRRHQGHPWQGERLPDIPMSKKKRLQAIIAHSSRKRAIRSPVLDPLSSPEGSVVHLPSTQDVMDTTSDDSYEDPDEDSDLDTGLDLIEDPCSHSGARRHFWGYQHFPKVKTKKPYHHDHHGQPLMPIGSRSTDALNPTIGDGVSSQPTNYRQMEGVVDAVLMAILYDKRNVLDVLLADAGKPTIQTWDRFPCFVGSIGHNSHYNDQTVTAMTEAHNASNLVSYFPVQVWNSCVMIGNPDPESFEPFDGIIRYPIIYMTAIAASVHRDIQLAYGDFL